MKFYKVVDEAIRKEILDSIKKQQEIKNIFLNASEKFELNSCQIKNIGFNDNLNDINCRGFSVNESSSQRHKFKLAHKGSTLLPKKKFENEVKDALMGLEFGLTYSMVETWNKLIKFNIKFDQKEMVFVRDGVSQCITLYGEVYVEITSTEDFSNVNKDALEEIKESEYLSKQGR